MQKISVHKSEASFAECRSIGDEEHLISSAVDSIALSTKVGERETQHNLKGMMEKRLFYLFSAFGTKVVELYQATYLPCDFYVVKTTLNEIMRNFWLDARINSGPENSTTHNRKTLNPEP